MLNSEEQYRECGRKAAKAMNQGDHALWQFEINYRNRMLSAENSADRAWCRDEFDKGYREVRHVPKVEFSR